MTEPTAFDASQDFDVTGRRVLVCGAAHGLGLAVATAFAGAGASVGAVDIDKAALVSLQDNWGEKGVAVTRIADVRDTTACHDAVNDIAHALGGIDVLVNDAAIFTQGPLAEFPPESFTNLVDVNVTGCLRIIAAAMPHLRRSNCGRIINFGSIAFFMGYPAGLGAYIATKGAVVGLSRSLARELGPDGITVNVIAPGAIPTRAEHGLFDDPGDWAAYDQEIIGQQALKRRGSVGDIASAVLFLSSDAAAFITGQTLAVDGGWMFN